MAERREYIESIKNSLDRFNEESRLIFEQLQELKSKDLTLETLISEISAIRENTVSEKLYEKLTNILEDLNQSGVKKQDLNQSVDEISESFMTGTNTLLEGIGSKISEMTKQNKLIVSGISKVGNYFSDVISPFYEIFGLFSGLFSIVQGAFGYITKLPVLLMGLTRLIKKDPTADKIQNLIDIEERKEKREKRDVDEDSSFLSELLLVAGQITGGIMAGIGAFSANLQQDIANMYKPFINVFKRGIFDPVKGWFDKENWITRMLNRIKNIKGISKLESLTSRFSRTIERIRKMFTSVAEKLTKARTWIDDLIKQSGKFGVVLGRIGSALGRVVLPLMIAYEVIRGMIKGETIRDKILEASAGILSIATQIPEWIINGILWAFGSEFRVDFGREAIVNAVNDISDWLFENVTEPIVNFLENFDIRQSFNNLVNKIQNTIDSSFNLVQDKYNDLKDMLIDFWNYIFNMEFLDSEIFDVVGDWLERTFDEVKKPFVWVKEKLQDFEQWLINNTFFDAETIDAIKNSMISAFNQVTAPFIFTKNLIQDFSEWLITTVFSDPSQVWEDIKTTLKNVFDWITSPFKSVTSKLESIEQWLINNTFFDAETIDAIKNSMISAFNQVTAPFRSVLGKLQEFWSWLTTTVFSDPSQAWDEIKSTLSSVFDKIKELFRPVKHGLNALYSLITGDFEGTSDSVDNILDSLISLMSNLFNNIKGFIMDNTPIGPLVNGINKLYDYLTGDNQGEETILESIISNLKDIPGKIADWVKSIIPSWEDDIEPKLKKIIPDWAEPWIFGKEVQVDKLKEEPKMTGKELVSTLLKGNVVEREVGLRGQPDQLSIKKSALEDMSPSQGRKLLETDNRWTKETRDSLKDLKDKATDKGSIYTHDIHLEDVLGNIKILLKDNIEDVDNISTVGSSKAMYISNMNEEIANTEMIKENKQRENREKETESIRKLLQSVNNNMSNNINNNTQQNIQNQNVQNEQTRDMNQFPAERIPDHIENWSLLVFNAGWGVL